MITYDDVVNAHPEAKNFPQDKVEQLVGLANTGFPDSRFKKGSAATADAGRVMYVMHMLMKVSTNINAPYIAARMMTPGKPGIKTPHPWDSTTFGQQLKTVVA